MFLNNCTILKKILIFIKWGLVLNLFHHDTLPVKKHRKSTNKANDLNGSDWLKNSVSIWNGMSKDTEERKLEHPAVFPWKLAYKVIETFTDSRKTNILDPFVGSGSTLVACHKLNKTGIGFDISKKYISISKSRIKKLESITKKKSKIQVVKSNAINVGKYIPNNTIDLCFTSPPYWDILSQKRTVDGKIKKEYHLSKENIGVISEYKQYLFTMKNIFHQVSKVLKPNAYCIINVMDLRKKSMFYPLHMDITQALCSVGYTLDDIIIWDRKQDYNNLRPLGYPYVFRVNKIHEFLLIFKKCKP